MNRQQKRAAKKAKPAWARLSVDERKAKLIRNGITPDDLKQEYTKGHSDGVSAGVEATFKTVYAATCLAMHRKYGFGKKRCEDVLTEIDSIVLNELTSEETIEKVWNEIGLRILFKEPFDRIEEID